MESGFFESVHVNRMRGNVKPARYYCVRLDMALLGAGATKMVSVLLGSNVILSSLMAWTNSQPLERMNSHLAALRLTTIEANVSVPQTVCG